MCLILNAVATNRLLNYKSAVSVTKRFTLLFKNLPLIFWQPISNSDKKSQILDLNWQANHLSKVQLNGPLTNSLEFNHEL